MPPRPRRPVASPVAPTVSRLRYTALAILFSALWAAAFIGVKVALRSSPPLFLMVVRFLGAGLLLLATARLLGHPIPATRRAWRPLVLLGLLNNALYLGLASVALRHLSAGMAAILASTNPLLLALFAALALGERLTFARVAGLITSFGGVLWIMESRIGDENRPGAIVLMLAAIAFLVTGTVMFKKLRVSAHLLVVNGGQLLAGGLVLLPPSLLWEPVGDVRLTTSFVAAQAFLIVGVSGAGMLIWFWLLNNGDATRASAYFFLNPVLGLVFGALGLGEPLRAHDLAGAVAVALGIYLVQRSSSAELRTHAGRGGVRA